MLIRTWLDDGQCTFTAPIVSEDAKLGHTARAFSHLRVVVAAYPAFAVCLCITIVKGRWDMSLTNSS